MSQRHRFSESKRTGRLLHVAPWPFTGAASRGVVGGAGDVGGRVCIADCRLWISEAQKNSLKGTLVGVLGNHKDSLNRTDIASQTGDDMLAMIGVKRDESAAKLRKPPDELGRR